MNKKAMDMGAISVYPDAKGDMRRYSTGVLSIRGSLISSTTNEKPLPNYLRASTNSCHDFCKYGQKHSFEAEAKHPFLLKLGNKLTLREESHQVNTLNPEERRKRLLIKIKSSSHQRAEFPDKIAVNKEKVASKIKDARFPEEHVHIKLQITSPTQKSTISSDQEVTPTSENEEIQAKGMNVGDQKKKQVIKSKTLTKSHSYSDKYKVSERKDISPDNEIEAFQKSGIKKNASYPHQEASSSIKPNPVRQTSLKSCITHDKPQNLRQKPPVPNVITQVIAKYETSKKVGNTPAVGSGSPLTPHGPTGQRNEKENFVKSREINKTLEKKVLKPSLTSPSLKHTGDGISSLKQRKYKHEKQTNPTKDQKLGKAVQDTQNNEAKTSYVIDTIIEKVDLDSTEQNSPKVENVACDSSKQPQAKCENSDLDSLQQKLLKPEKSDMGLPGQKLLEPDSLNFDSIELKPDDQELLELKNADMDFVEQKLLNPENIDFDSLELKPDDKKLLEPESADMLEQNLLKPEEIGFESLEMKPTNRKLHEPENADMDFLEQKLLKPEDIDLASLDFLEQKLLKPESIDLDSLELKPKNDQSLQSTSEDEEKIMVSEFASSESTESESNHEVIESNSNSESSKGEQRRRARRNAVVHPEDKLSSPYKLRFRRGKIIELHPQSNCPRRLRFRRGRLVGGSVSGGEAERKNFQRSETSVAASDPNPETQSAVLKHQEQEKKDAQRLFNNVIEETASKLVETRKSKVKALVGAFETVISLQDSKSASTA